MLLHSTCQGRFCFAMSGTLLVVSIQFVALLPQATRARVTSGRELPIPEIYEIRSYTPVSLHIKWRRPPVGDDSIIGYWIEVSRRVECVQSRCDWKKSVYVEARKLSEDVYTVRNLSADTCYLVTLTADVVSGAEGLKSVPFSACTDVAGPSAPFNVIVKRLGISMTVIVSWKRPSVFYRGIDRYYITLTDARGVTTTYIQNDVTELLKKTVNFEISHLEADIEYYVSITGATNSLFRDRDYRGESSKPKMFFLRGGLQALSQKVADPKVRSRAGEALNVPCVEKPLDDISKVLWESSSIPIGEFTKETRVRMQPEYTGRFDISDTNYNLIIKNPVVSDSSLYVCKYERMNQSFTATKEIEVVIQDVPSPPLNVTLETISAFEMEVKWKAPLLENNSPIRRYSVEIREVGQSWKRGNQVPAVQSATKLTRLQPFTKYESRVFAESEVGRSEPSVISAPNTTFEAKPTGSPTIKRTYNISSTAISMEWDEPNPSTVNGKLTGYSVSYMLTDHKLLQPPSPDVPVKPIWVPKPATSVNITGLKSYRNYTIKLTANNGVGTSPPAVVQIQTDEGVPSSPRIIDAKDQTSTSMRVLWERPQEKNGIITRYEIFWKIGDPAVNATKKSMIIDGDKTFESVIDGLTPYKTYEIEVAAYTRKGIGKSSVIFRAATDVQGPSQPLNVTVTKNETNLSIEISWKRPSRVFKLIDRYYINLTPQNSDGKDIYIYPDPSQRPDEILHHTVDKLSPNTKYTIQIRAETTSRFQKDYYHKGKYSKKMVVEFTGQKEDNSKFTAGVIGGIVTILLLVIIAVVLLVIYRRYKRYRYLQQREPEPAPPPEVVLEDYDPNESRTVTTEEFAEHVGELHRDSDLGFSQEFEEIYRHTRTDLTFDHSLDPENKAKNRYVNINAYDHSRVSLRQVSKQKHVDYINGNYCDGYHKKKAYIATQGPLPTTIADFWRMVWEQNSGIIVMITNLVEKGRVKCDQYWPNEGTETYGLFQVKILNTRVMAHYTVRVFTIRHSKARRVNMRHHQGERLVYQFHYTDWPDHGVPDYTLPVLTLVKKSSQMASSDSGPIIIHCSAGVGRTGTYIVLDSMMKQIKEKKTVNVFGFLLHIRNQRNFLVQTEEQYIFIHDALLEFIKCGGETEIKAQNLQDYITKITATSDGEDESELAKQFKLITTYKPAAYELTFAQKPVNVAKNRSQNLVPVNSKRVILPAQPGVEGSDYINASFLHGYNDKKEYIITQHPLKGTQQDFWRMVWDQNSSTVVLLSKVDDMEYEQFWPKADRPMDCHNFNVSLTEEHHQISQTARDFMLESKQDDYELMTKLVSSHGWPKNCDPVSTAFDLVKSVKNWYNDHHSGPIIVIDKFGGAAAATFCALSTLYDEFQQDDEVDVYQIARLYYLQRQGIFTEEGEYEFLYKAIASISHEPSDRKDSLSSGNQAVLNSIHNSHSHHQQLHVHGGSVHLRDKKGERPPRPETTI